MADMIVAETTCDGKKKMYEIMGLTKRVEVLELTQKSDSETALKHWTDELRKFRRTLEKEFNVEITDRKLRDSIRTMNRERTLLKQQIVDGLGIDELGALYEVHRATAARWVAAAREKLLLRTRRAFMVRVRISSDECESIMRMVRSQLDVSLHRRLAAS